MAQDDERYTTSESSPYFSPREYATEDEAFARIKLYLDPDPDRADRAAWQLFRGMLDGHLGFGATFLTPGPNDPYKSSAVLTSEFLVRYGFQCFLISDDGMHLRLWPLPSQLASDLRIYIFIKRTDLDREYPPPPLVMSVRIVDQVVPVRVVDVEDGLLARCMQPIKQLVELATSIVAPRPPPKDLNLPKPDQTWLDATYKRLKAEGIIRPKMGKRAVAKALVRAMELDPTVSPMAVKYVADSVGMWGYFPVK